MEHDDYWDEEDECQEEDEEITPENCSIGMFSSGMEECEFCFWRDVCAEEFRKLGRA